jgi:hypothetical protein
MLTLIGNVEKSHAMQTLFGARTTQRSKSRQKSCEIYLHLSPASISDEQPLMLVEWDVRKACDKWNGAKRNRCYAASQSTALSQSLARERAADSFQVQLLSPFTDVFCFFADDLGDFRQVARRLARWLEQGRSSTLPVATLPSVVITTSKFAPTAAVEAEARKAFLHMLAEESSNDPFQQLSAIDVLAVRSKRKSSAKARFRRLKEHLKQRSQLVQKNRKTSHVSFSATHLGAFFYRASMHLASSTNTPFDFVTASRTFNTVAPDMHEHFSNFLKQVSSMQQLTDFVAPMIASALLLDSYPPDAPSWWLLPRYTYRLTI